MVMKSVFSERKRITVGTRGNNESVRAFGAKFSNMVYEICGVCRIQASINILHVWTIAALSAHRYWKVPEHFHAFFQSKTEHIGVSLPPNMHFSPLSGGFSVRNGRRYYIARFCCVCGSAAKRG